MQQTTYWYLVEVNIEFSLAEIEHLIFLGNGHYDGKCKAAGKHGGFLYGMRNMFESMRAAGVVSARTEADLPDSQDQVVELQINTHDLSTLVKIAESEQYEKGLGLHLWFPLMQILRKTIARSSYVNSSIIYNMINNYENGII